MQEIDYEKIGLKVGLEIHQQLATNKKLFCNCRQIESEEYTKKFTRKLRVSKSEMGEYDPAAIFEKTKSKTIIYYCNPQSSCLVEEDEEPPHPLDSSAKQISLLIALTLGSKVFREVFPMRKIVIDGSNTSGFQRTMLISQGGYLNTDDKKIKVQSICLEEDAAKLIGDEQNTRKYSLDRLGIPLIEIALEPVNATPSEMKKIALSLGRLLRTTKKVARGLGSIRQDVNVSINGSGIVEVKGVQQLDQLEKVVEFEAKRQYGLYQIGKKIQKDIIITKNDIFDITNILKNSKSKIIQKNLKDNCIIKAIRVGNFAGLFGFEPYSGIRLGKEIGQLVKSFGIGGVFHSDELPNYGIEQNDVNEIIKHIQAKKEDAFLIIAAKPQKVDHVIEAIIDRIIKAPNGAPSETRLATQTGETVFLRPKPGASRMYPETDIPPILIKDEELEIARQNIPKPWDELIDELKQKYNLNSQLAEQIFDSPFTELFEKICQKNVSPNFVASVLCSTITSLERKGLNANLLKPKQILETFEMLATNKITKESVEIIFQQIMSGNSNSVSQAVQKLSIGQMTDSQLEDILLEIAKQKQQLIKNLGQRSIGPLMGIAMKNLRGKASGEKVNSILKSIIAQFGKENEK